MKKAFAKIVDNALVMAFIALPFVIATLEIIHETH